MSKAFTKEDGADEPALQRAPPKVAAGERRYVTVEGYQALQAELQALQAERLSQGEGALSEAAQRAERDQRMALLQATLAALTPFTPEPSQLADGRIYFGAWVTLEEEDGATRTYRIVGPDEVDVKAGRVSSDSPLARALLGRGVGDVVTLERPRGPVELTVTSVRYG